MWAFGVIFFYTLTHRFPFIGSNEVEIKKAILEAEPDYKGIEGEELTLVV